LCGGASPPPIVADGDPRQQDADPEAEFEVAEQERHNGLLLIWTVELGIG
jgi:hypothetical protein